MNSAMSGWSTSSTTIFAARRVLPPDLIVPAHAAGTRLKHARADLGVHLGREVAVGAAPAGDRVDDAADHLFDAPLALGRGHAAAEILLVEDIGRWVRPELREHDVLLVEDRLLLAGDEGVADLPLDLVERVAARDRELATHGQARRFVDDGVLSHRGCRCLSLYFLGGRHPVLP